VTHTVQQVDVFEILQSCMCCQSTATCCGRGRGKGL